MDVAKLKLNKIKKTLRAKILTSKEKCLLDYGNNANKITIDGKTYLGWADALQTAINENERVYIPNGEYVIEKAVVIPSNRSIRANKNAIIRLADNIATVMLRNKDVIDGSNKSIPKDAPITENIFIEGGVWTTGQIKRSKYGKEGAFDNEDSMHGVHALMLFSGVKNLYLRNLTFKSTGTFAVQIGRAENFIVEKIRLVNCFADGVHLNGDLLNGVVFNVKGQTEDDLVAINAYDWANSTINLGSVENIAVSRINCTGGHCHCMRILPGVFNGLEGEIDCSIKNAHFSYIKGVATFKMYLQTPAYKLKPEGTKVGFIDNITFENISLEKNAVSDNVYNYHEKDLTTGHFGVFEIGSNVGKFTLKNIKAKLNYLDFPDTGHFITVGPKSSYLKEYEQELFDPYINCTVKEIEYKRIYINGKKIKDLNGEIKEICFNNLYPSNFSSGLGKVEKIHALK